jgi:hypothetical protein
MSALVASKIEQAEQAEHGHQGEIARVRRVPGRGEQGLELQVGESQGR